MSLYKIGCCLPVVGYALEKQEYQVGALIATPGFIRDQVMALDTEILATDRDIWDDVQPQGQGSLMAWYMESWAPFTAEWAKFRERHSGWLDNFWGSTLDTVNQYRVRLRDLRASYKSQGGDLVSPEPRAPEQGWFDATRDAVAGIGKFVKNVIYVLLALAGGYVLYKLVVVSKGTRTLGPA